jgi:hypothetical protein
LIANCTLFSSATAVSFRIALLTACFQGSYFAQAPQVSLSLAILGGQERLDEVPGHSRSHGPAAHANAEMDEQLLLQTKPTVISGNAYAHVCFSMVCGCYEVRCREHKVSVTRCSRGKRIRWTMCGQT